MPLRKSSPCAASKVNGLSVSKVRPTGEKATSVVPNSAQGDHILPIPGTRSVAHLNELAAARDILVTEQMMAEIEAILPVGWAHGDRYSQAQWVGPERYC